MRSAKADKETLWQIADAMLGRGEMPTVRAVIKETGGGSPNRITPILREWRSARGLAAAVPNTRADRSSLVRQSSVHDERVVALEARLTELERKLAEAGR